MKKILLNTILLLGIFISMNASAVPTVESCGNFGGSAGGCAKCFRETDHIYGCNQYQSCSQFFGINYLSDTMVNTGTITKIMYSSPLDRAGRVEFARLQTQTDWSLSSSDMFRVPSTFSPLYTGTSGIYYMLSGSASVKWIETKPGEFIRLNSVSQGASRTQPAYRVSFVPRTYDLISVGNLGPAVDHRQCLFIYPRFCGDGVNDTDRGEQCDDGNMNSGDGCSNTCQTEVPLCNALTITPTSVTNGGTITYTCSGTNAGSYSIIAERPDGSTFASSTSPGGALILPVGQPSGSYKVSCFITGTNGQVVTAPACQKTFTNTINQPVCTGLTVSPTSVTNGGNVTYTCTGDNVTSYSVVLKRPDGSTIQTLTSATGTLTVPAAPEGTYTASCFVNGQTTTPSICQKTVTNNMPSPVCTDLSVTPGSVTNGGNVTYTCNGNNVSSYSVVFSRPDGTILQTLATQNGSVTIPATPTGNYTARCFVNGQTTTPESCQKTVPNNTVVTPVCTGLTVSPTSVTNGGNVTYTCTGDNVTSYSVVLKRPDGSTIQTLTSATGTLTVPAAPEGTYTASCFVNGQTTTPSICQKTVTNNIPSPVCTDLSVTPGSVTNGGNVTYTCNGNNVSSYSVVFSKPDGTVLQTLATQNGSVTIPATPTGNYTAKCFVNGQTTTPESCQKTVPNNTVVVNPTCDNLTLTTSGSTVNYSCTGTGNITSYTMLQNGGQISTSASGSVILGYGTYTFQCYVNSSITSTSCQKTVTLAPNPTYPNIQVIKDDNDNHDDSQVLQIGGVAQFTVAVRNNGSEPLDSVTLADPYAPACNRTIQETQNMIILVGNRDFRLDPGETFSYICNRPQVYQNTFPNNENRVCVNGRGITSGIAVNSCDVTRVNFTVPTTVCQNMQVTQNGTQTSVYCSPNGAYKLYVLEGRRVINTLQNPTGQFTFGLSNGTYKVVCVKEGETVVQPNCQKSITVSPNQYCELTSTVKYGGAPLRTQLKCSAPNYAQCMIRIRKDGKPWRSVADCHGDIIFEERGVYDAQCIVGDAETESCNTRIQVDVMTIIKTGPFVPTVILLALGMAGYITYRRKKVIGN